MQIELKSIKIADLIDGYVNDPDTGVKGYHGKLGHYKIFCVNGKYGIQV